MNREDNLYIQVLVRTEVESNTKMFQALTLPVKQDVQYLTTTAVGALKN